MNNKEILLDLLKHSLGERLNKLEKKNNEEESSLKLIKKSYDDFTKQLNNLIKLREQKIAKDKLEEQKKNASKKAEEARKTKKKEPAIKGRKSNINTTAIKKTNDKINDKKTFNKTKSSANFDKKPIGRSRGKSVTRLNTEKNEISRNTIGINNTRRKTIGNKKDAPVTEAPRRNTISGKKSLKPSKSMGKLRNKPTLKKASGSNDNDNNKKKEIQEMQQLVNNIKIQNKNDEKDEKNEKEKQNEKENEIEKVEEKIEEKVEEKAEEIEEKKEEPQIELPPPDLLSCHKEGILEKSIIQFLTIKEQINLFSCNKELALLNLSILKDKLSFYKKICDIYIGQTIDDKINFLSIKFSEDDLKAPIKNYELSKGCAKAVKLLDEELYLQAFIRPPNEKTLDEIIIVYKLFCQLLNKEDFVQIKNDKKFWEKFSKYILDNKGDKLSEFCLKCAAEFNFENKNILKLRELAKGKVDKLKPAYFGKICGTTGLFIFLVKDALEYCGAIEDKKTSGSRIKANYLYQKSLFDDLNKYIKFLEGLSIKKEENENKDINQ